MCVIFTSLLTYTSGIVCLYKLPVTNLIRGLHELFVRHIINTCRIQYEVDKDISIFLYIWACNEDTISVKLRLKLNKLHLNSCGLFYQGRHYSKCPGRCHEILSGGLTSTIQFVCHQQPSQANTGVTLLICQTQIVNCVAFYRLRCWAYITMQGYDQFSNVMMGVCLTK